MGMIDEDEPSVEAVGERHRGACGKACYPGQSSAKAALRRLQERGKGRTWEGRLHVYQCRDCGAWHVGHTYRHG